MPHCIFCDQDTPAGIANCRLCGAPLPHFDSEALPADVFHKQLVQLVNEGQRVQAIAAYRRHTGVDLNAAVEVIDSLERDRQFTVTPGAADLEWEIISHLERGEKIGAIKLYRDRTRAGLKEAKDAVEAIEARMGLGPDPARRAGCLGMLVVAVALAGAVTCGT